MSANGFDWNVIDMAVNKARTSYEYEAHKHLFQKVAFDRFKPLSGNSPQLWELRAGEDGKQYLFALYNEAEDLVSISGQDKTWEAQADADAKNITLAYKKTPVYRLSIADHGYSKTEAREFASFIEKQAQSKEFVDNMLGSMSEKRRAAVQKLIQGE